jgi:ADP-ribose pyrophosphatase YjhB (NUDIX family)
MRVAGIIIQEGRILLMFRRKDGQEYYAIPGGMVEKGETEEHAVVREVFEETGYASEIGKELWRHKGVKGKEKFYLMKNITGLEELGGPEAERNSPENYYELKWVPLVDLKDTRLLPEEIKEKIIIELT